MKKKTKRSTHFSLFKRVRLQTYLYVWMPPRTRLLRSMYIMIYVSFFSQSSYICIGIQYIVLTCLCKNKGTVQSPVSPAISFQGKQKNRRRKHGDLPKQKASQCRRPPSWQHGFGSPCQRWRLYCHYFQSHIFASISSVSHSSCFPVASRGPREQTVRKTRSNLHVFLFNLWISCFYHHFGITARDSTTNWF